jgi:hypothetical protein
LKHSSPPREPKNQLWWSPSFLPFQHLHTAMPSKQASNQDSHLCLSLHQTKPSSSLVASLNARPNFLLMK